MFYAVQEAGDGRLSSMREIGGLEFCDVPEELYEENGKDQV